MGLNESDIRRIVWTAVQAFVASLAVTVPGFLAAPNFSTAKGLTVSAIVAAVAAALSALKNVLLPDSSTLK